MSSTEQPVPAAEPAVLDFGPFVLILTRDGKVVLAPKDQPTHATIHFGGSSGIIDAHVTTQGPAPTHDPLGGLRVGDLDELLNRIQPTFERNMERLMRRVVRPVRFGWLRHKGILALPFPMDDQTMLSLGRRRGRRWKLDQQRFAEHFGSPLCRTEFESGSSPAALLARRRDMSSGIYGAVFRIPFPDGRVRFCWFKASDLLRELEALWRHYGPAIRPHLLGPDQMREVKSSAEGTKHE